MAGKRTLLPPDYTKLSTRVILACVEHPQILRTYAILEGLAWGNESRTVEFDGDWFEKEFSIPQLKLFRHLSFLHATPIQAVLCYRSAGSSHRRFTITMSEMTSADVSIIKNDNVIKNDNPCSCFNNNDSIKESIKNKNNAIIKNDTVSKMIIENEPGPEIPTEPSIFEEIPGKKNIFTLYEEEIGPLTPLVADALKDAEKDFPEKWIVEAFGIAAEMNKRRWKYIDGILNNWKRDGYVPRSMNAKSVSGKAHPGDAPGENSQRSAPPSDADLATAERILQMQSV